MIGAFILWSDNRPNGPGWVIDGNGCHIWTGSKARGYGMVSVGGRYRYVHRVRYEREVGPIPEGMQLDHFACDNGAGGCCNPGHCRPVTPRENALRSNCQSSLNAAKTHCPRGHLLAGDNLPAWGLRQGQRKCRACTNTHDRERKRIVRAKAKKDAQNGGYLYQ